MKTLNVSVHSRNLRGWLWHRKFDLHYSSRAGLSSDGRTLRLFLGPAYSGIEWFAGILAHALDLSRETIESCVLEEDGSYFVFSEDDFSWWENKVPVEGVETARAELMTGFGSCSFENRKHYALRRVRIGRALEDYQLSGTQVLRNRPGGTFDVGRVRILVSRYGRRNGDVDNVACSYFRKRVRS